MTSKSVLLVEDNPDDVELALHAFKKANFDCRIDVLTSGSEALDFLLGRGKFKALTKAELPTLIILDLQLPDISGTETIRQVRAVESIRYIPMVVLTTSNEPDDIQRAYMCGANSYIRKPVMLKEFIALIEQVGQYWLDTNHIYP